MANPEMWDGSYQKQPKDPDKRARKSPLKSGKRPKKASDTRKALMDTWAIIRRSMILAQERTNGYTSCMECGLMNPKVLDLDHIWPAGKGGRWIPDNAQLLCRGPGTNDCHGKKHGQPQWTTKEKAS